jgi:hypothetical protein
VRRALSGTVKTPDEESWKDTEFSKLVYTVSSNTLAREEIATRHESQKMKLSVNCQPDMCIVMFCVISA